MKVIRTHLPKSSILNSSHTEYHYVDSFQGVINDSENKFTSEDVGKAFFSGGPKWVEKLFEMRNKVVSLLGLKTPGNFSESEAQLENFKCEPGDRVGLFQVFAKTETEVILGEDDKHLNFRISIFLTPHTKGSTHKKLILSTTVVFKNWFGRLYFIPVRPFHKLIVPRMLKRIIDDLEGSNTSLG
ncbi:DUF2867 domain-containing protein [Pleomorphovibrio marinus]|uniref:DUF2867 domain-containing protein n=1 Tax=Pleomorphovibrio marinus TaxID=2164132 RepID=UPI000E0B5C2B|nr:DUF2867 domain-containing protein [Pleomorphovibrio marinus]